MVRSTRGNSFDLKVGEFSTSHDPLISLQNLSISSGDTTSITDDELLDNLATDNGDVFSDKERDGHEVSGYGDESSDTNDGFPPASPISSTTSSQRGLSMRDSVLTEVWERRKEMVLQDELANLKEYAMPHLLGRSSSDCGATVSAMIKHQLFARSTSSIGKNGSPALSRTRTRSLTDDDFEELKGFIDLGFGFDETSLSALGHTLPALEVYCSVAQSLQGSPYGPSPAASPSRSWSSMTSTPPWRVCSPGDAPEEVKGRLRHWAQAVACNVRLCY